MLTVSKIVSDFLEALGRISRREAENIWRFAQVILIDFHLLLLFISEQQSSIA